jgi:predicted dehydrogenase
LITDSDLTRALGSAQPDFVVNATVPAAHRDVTIACLDAGIPVICEKPMADSMEAAREMVEASERNGVLLKISQQRTHDPRLAALRRLIQERIGRLGILNSDFYQSHPEADFHREMASPLLLDMAIHTFDAARFLSGADPVSVYCDDFNLRWSWWGGNPALTAVFEMSDGLRYTYRGSWSVRGRLTPWEAEWRADGPGGTAHWDGRGTPEAEVVADRAASSRAPTTRVLGKVDATAPSDVTASLRDFLHALDTGATPLGECHDNIKSLAMVFGAMESARSGRRVAIRVD